MLFYMDRSSFFPLFRKLVKYLFIFYLALEACALGLKLAWFALFFSRCFPGLVYPALVSKFSALICLML